MTSLLSLQGGLPGNFRENEKNRSDKGTNELKYCCILNCFVIFAGNSSHCSGTVMVVSNFPQRLMQVFDYAANFMMTFFYLAPLIETAPTQEGVSPKHKMDIIFKSQ